MVMVRVINLIDAAYLVYRRGGIRRRRTRVRQVLLTHSMARHPVCRALLSSLISVLPWSNARRAEPGALSVSRFNVHRVVPAKMPRGEWRETDVVGVSLRSVCRQPFGTTFGAVPTANFVLRNLARCNTSWLVRDRLAPLNFCTCARCCCCCCCWSRGCGFVY